MAASMARSAPASIRPGTAPVFVVGAGAIVRDAHLPAYAKAGIPVEGIFDLDGGRARALAGPAGARVHDSLAELSAAARSAGGVVDLALPPQALAGALAALPEGTVVLAQKPFGRDLAEATELLRIAGARRLCGAVNFQLRHAPAVAALRALLASGAIGEPLDLEIRVVCSMPWETWRFLEGMPRMEVLMHSIHYLDLVRALFGEPDRVWCATARHPGAPALADTRSTSVLSFGAERRAVVSTFHHHRAPERHDASHLRVEGTRGTAVVRLGVNLDYPRGRRDTLEWSADGGPWREEPVAGDWFPDAFAASMRALQRFAARESIVLESSFADAWRTMALVETCYKSAAAGERPPDAPAL